MICIARLRDTAVLAYGKPRPTGTELEISESTWR